MPYPVTRRRYTAAKKLYIPKNKKPEEDLQIRVSNYLKKYYPHIDFHSDFAAGMKMTEWQAKRRKAMNSGRGWSDMFIPYPSRGYHGLFIELKKHNTAIYVTRGPRKGELVKNEQIEIEADFLNRMNKLGYFGRFGVGYDETIRLIRWYFNEPQQEELF